MINEITIDHRGIKLAGHISSVLNARSWVIFAHGSGSSRFSSRNNWVANELNQQGHSTLLFDLLTPQEDLIYENRFNLPLLAERLQSATEWLLQSTVYKGEPLVYFGASTGAGAALIAASKLPRSYPLLAVISRGGRPDLAGISALKAVSVPVLLIVGDLDHEVINLNKFALTHLQAGELELVAGASHLFEEPGTLSKVVKYSGYWLDKLLGRNLHKDGDHVST